MLLFVCKQKDCEISQNKTMRKRGKKFSACKWPLFLQFLLLYFGTLLLSRWIDIKVVDDINIGVIKPIDVRATPEQVSRWIYSTAKANFGLKKMFESVCRLFFPVSRI
jgi:hypothetical protein